MVEHNYRERFMNLEDDFCRPETSAVWVLPVPLEMTVSFLRGTARGPEAIIDVSYELELYDADVDADGAIIYGIHTLPMLRLPLTSMQHAVETITDAVKRLPLGDRLLVTLGGEHAVTPGVVAALASKYTDLVVVQIDAHNDLRDTFNGTAWSHACAMRRCLPYASIIQLGIRSQASEEIEFLRETDKVTIWTAEAIHRDTARNYLQSLAGMLHGHHVYLTIDVDGFDPSVFPTTGTPYPGGIGWYDGLDIIRTVAQAGNVIGFDCVEFAPPLDGGQDYAHAAAVLVYKTINAIMLARGKIKKR
ncbi:MAG TPA: agmatinase [Aggregatilineaceae bacterium]|nr:agmatinase [Aggregatilineaceae bacterium]